MVVTLVERKTGIVRVGKLARATGELTLGRTVNTIHLDRERAITITADNGAEFHMYKELYRQCFRKGSGEFAANPFQMYAAPRNNL